MGQIWLWFSAAGCRWRRRRLGRARRVRTRSRLRAGVLPGEHHRGAGRHAVRFEPDPGEIVRLAPGSPRPTTLVPAGVNVGTAG